MGAYFDLDLGILICSRRVRTRSCARVSGEEGRFGGRTGGGGCGCGRSARSWRNLAAVAAASRLVCDSAREMAAKARARAGGRENAGDRWRARASARAGGGARENSACTGEGGVAAAAHGWRTGSIDSTLPSTTRGMVVSCGLGSIEDPASK